MDDKSALLPQITTHLARISDTPALDASVLLAHILGKSRTWVLAHPELTLSSHQEMQLHESLARIENGEPFPYILGYWEFFGLEFDISSDVLIPRPETELLVEKAIAWLKEFPQRRAIADIGTGSGAIAISIAVNIPDAMVLATDISERALDVAKGNASKHLVSDRVKFVQCDLLPDIPSNSDSPVDLICANLPYIPTETLRSLPIYEHEPTLALDGGIHGLDLIQRLLELAPKWLVPDGLFLLEIEATRGNAALKLAKDLFPRAEFRLHQDLTGHDRLLEIAL